MSNETEFAEGIIVKAPRDGAPDFVKASISIKRKELIGWLSGRSGEWVNLDVKESRNGKWYAAVNTYQPKGDKPQRNGGGANQARGGDPNEDIPFAPLGGLA